MKVVNVMKGVAVASLASAASVSAVTFPASWSPVYKSGGGLYVDGVHAPPGPEDPSYDTPPSPEYTDIVGGLDSSAAGPYAAGYWAMDANHLFFRMRVDNPVGANPQTVWQALLNTDGDQYVDWVVQLDLSGDNQVELAQNSELSPVSPWDADLGNSHVGAGTPATDFYQFVSVGDGSLFHQPTNDQDTFVDFAFPLTTFATQTGMSFSNSFGVAFSTSASHSVLNKDLPDSGWGVIPEPTSALLLLLGSAALLRRRSR